MRTMNQIASGLYKAISESESKKTKPYDTKAEVLREDGDVVWVKIPGGVDETPVQKTNNASPGDTVMVRISGGRAWLLGNNTSPATDDTMANIANETALGASAAADIAITSAAKAQESATIAEAEAGRAHVAANDAVASSIAANIASNSALTQLSVVEDVASVLTWISEHGTYKASTDTSVISGKLYFTKSGDDYSLITNPTGNPSASNYYEISTIGDESVANYISSHLALTNAGLWVLKDNASYKILLAPDGLMVYDKNGNLVSTFGQSITFSDTRVQYIGNPNAYILFDPANNGSITIGGSNITLGTNKQLSELISTVDNTLIYDHTYEYTARDANNNPTQATFTAYLYRGGVDIKLECDPEDFLWFRKTESGEVDLGAGYQKVVDISQCGYGAEIIGKYSPSSETVALANNGDILTNADNTPFSVRATGDSIRVRDLSVTTTIFSTDKVMIIGSEDEHLATIHDLSDLVDKTFVYTQETPSAEWVVNHGLHKNPSISVVDSAGSEVIGDYQYIDLNNVILTFSGAFAGKAFFN